MNPVHSGLLVYTVTRAINNVPLLTRGDKRGAVNCDNNLPLLTKGDKRGAMKPLTDLFSKHMWWQYFELGDFKEKHLSCLVRKCYPSHEVQADNTCIKNCQPFTGHHKTPILKALRSGSAVPVSLLYT